jgi:hypothetical protein
MAPASELPTDIQAEMIHFRRCPRESASSPSRLSNPGVPLHRDFARRSLTRLRSEPRRLKRICGIFVAASYFNSQFHFFKIYGRAM